MQIIFMSIFAGVLGTGFGGLLTALIGKRTDKMICIFLSFAGGVMTSIVCFELIPESMELSNVWVAILGLISGVVLVLFLNMLIDKISNTDNKKPKLHETHEEFYHASEVITNKNNMLNSVLIMFVAIALHNIPEGLAISAPLISSGMKKIKVLVLTIMAGVPTILGAMVW